MRIDAYNQISQVYQTNSTKKTTKASSTTATATDQVQISSFGRDYQTAKKAVAEASDIREDKVAETKSKYSGDYEVDTDDFASKLLDAYNSKF